MVRTYSPEFKETAVRMMIKHQKEHHCSRWASTVAVSKEVGVSPNSIWNWFKKGALEAEECMNLMWRITRSRSSV
ncbi:transposase-like protein [Corynebacterium diphtheriae bv. mitis]|nr:transposase [Corynebacterium diphtheriae]SUY73061.1 transposase-like protein [Corynebacterium diphtheriae bv. mitis]